MRRTAALWALAGFALLVAVIAGPARAEPDNTVPAKVSEAVVADLARADLDAVATAAAKYMGSSVADRIKNSFAAIKNLGQAQYTDLAYSRDFGKTEKDIIYKIDFDKGFVFVRFLWEIDNANWRLIHLAYKTENELPFPAGWEHIYPK